MRRKYAAIMIMAIGVLLFSVFITPKNTAYAATATAVRVVSVEYYEEQIIVLNNGNSKIYFATEVEAAKDDWEAVNSDPGMFTMIDISWLSPTIDNILVIRGEEDKTQSRVIIGERPLKLEININYADIDKMKLTDSIAPLVNIMTSVGNGSSPVTFDDLEWKKGISGQWTSTRNLTVGLLSKYLVKGTYLYFRLRALDDAVTFTYNGAPVDFNLERIVGIPGGIRRFENLTPITIGTDYPDGTAGRRFSNEVKVKIAKKSTAMVYGIDGERFTAEIKYGKEYRVTVGSGSPSAWVQVTDRATKTIPLTTILNSSSYDGTIKSKAFPAMTIEIRDYATSKSASSKITEISLNAQRTLDQNAVVVGKAPADAVAKKDTNLYVSYNGNKNMVIAIPLASPDLPYEYCIVKKGETLDLNRVVWTSVTKGTDVKILASKAVEGGMLYIRQKEIQSEEATYNSPAVAYELASTYVTHPISYPSIPEIVDASYTFTKGYSGDVTFTAELNVAGKLPFETAIKNIKLGTKDILFTAVPSVDAAGINYLTITLKKESLATLTNCYARPITINYMNGTVDKTSVKLTIQSPIPAGSLTITNAKGTTAGTTAFTMVTSKGTGNSWYYVVGDAEIKGINTQDTIASITSLTATSFTATTVDNVTTAANQYLTIFEVDASGHIVKYKSIQITADLRL